MKGEEYKCYICKGVFEKNITSEESQKRLELEFPGFTKDECEILCDDCYQKEFGNNK